MSKSRPSQLPLFAPKTDVFAFAFALLRRVLQWAAYLAALILALTIAANRLWGRLKFQIIRRLIWGGGRLGQPITHAGVLAMAFSVFLVGGLFSGSSLVRSASSAAAQSFPLPDILSATATPETKRPEDRPRDEVFIYEVEGGDTLSSIGKKFQISIETIKYANDLGSGDGLAVGQKLTILPVSGVWHTVRSGDSVQNLADKYKANPQTIVDFNYLNEPFALKIGERLMIPDAAIPQPIPPKLSAPSVFAGTVPSAGSGRFLWPTSTRLITQYFSYYHPAIDIGSYSPIYASDAGTVVFAGWSSVGYGFLVEVDHGNGYKTGYAHLSRINVGAGQSVGRGEVIGTMGATGNAFGVHLHFMVWQGGRFINPLSVL